MNSEDKMATNLPANSLTYLIKNKECNYASQRKRILKVKLQLDQVQRVEPSPLTLVLFQLIILLNSVQIERLHSS